MCAVVNVVIIKTGSKTKQELRKLTTAKILEMVSTELIQIGMHFGFKIPKLRKIKMRDESVREKRLDTSLSHDVVSKW